MKQNPATVFAYAIHPELTAAVEAAHAAIAQAKKVAEMVNEAAAKIPQLEAEIGVLRHEIASAEVAEALADDGDRKVLRKAIERQKAELVAKEGDLRSAQTRVTVLEQRAPEYDVAVRAAGEVLHAEHQTWLVATKTALSVEIEVAIKPLVDVMAKARVVGWRHLADFLDDAMVPDLLNYTSIYRSALKAADVSTNRLKGQLASAEGLIAVEAIRSAIQPVEHALVAVRSYRPYMPLAARQVKPYEIKGWTSGVRDHFINQSDVAADKPAAAPAFQPQELNLGPAMVENAGRPAPQVQQ